MAVAITLTPGSSPGQALTLSHQGRGDIEVLPEDVFGVSRVVAHVTREMSQLVSCVVHFGGFYVDSWLRSIWVAKVLGLLSCGCMNPCVASLRVPLLLRKKGRIRRRPAAAPGIPRSMALLAPSRAPVVGLLGFAKGAGDGYGRLYGVVKGG